jgi:hypothetical protein
MQDRLIGQVLCEMRVLNEADVKEVLNHQRRTRQKFGQIAIRWGLATAEQVWEAWARQLVARGAADLGELGLDTPALECLSLADARRLSIAPLRLWGGHLVVAGPPDTEAHVIDELVEKSGCQVHVCPCDRQTIQAYLDQLWKRVCVA